MTKTKAWREELEALGVGMNLNVDIKPEKAGLVIIDMQYYTAHPEYFSGKILRKVRPDLAAAWADRLTNEVIPNCRKILTLFRENKMKVFHFTFGSLTKDGSDMLASRKRGLAGVVDGDGAKGYFNKWEFEHKIIEDLEPESDEIVLNKTTRSVFNSTGIEHTLKMMGIETLVFVGTDTTACVESSVRDSSDLGFNTIVLDDACITSVQSRHDASMVTIQLGFGQVMDTDELIAEISKSNNPGA